VFPSPDGVHGRMVTGNLTFQEARDNRYLGRQVTRVEMPFSIATGKLPAMHRSHEGSLQLFVPEATRDVFVQVFDDKSHFSNQIQVQLRGPEAS